MPEAKPGVYRHHKGGYYRVLSVAQDSENGRNNGRMLVVYVSLTYGHMCVRPFVEFFEFVGSGNERQPRFVYVGERVQ